MRKLLLILLTLLPLFLAAQTYPPIVQGSKLYKFKNGAAFDSAVFLPRRDTTNADPTMLAPGMLQWKPSDQSLYYRDSTSWRRLAAGPNVADQIDTIPLVDSLEEYTGTAIILFVTDPYRGGFFVKKTNGSNNGITEFFSHDGDYWHRVYNAEDGILVDWAGADPTGVLNSAPAFQAAFAFSNHVSLRANATYLITDSLTILNKTNFVLDGKNATIKESTSFYTTLLVKKGFKVTIKDLNFDGPENYAYFLTSDPASKKQHIYVDSSDRFTGYHLYSQNKRGMITMSNCSYYSLDDLHQDGIFKNGVASNVLGTFGIQVVGYGFNEPITYWTGKATINKFIAKNTGAAILIADNATYLNITNCTFDSTYNNGIYISSGLWCSVMGNVMRNIGGTGIKARGFGYTITGNVITNADLGIVVTGNSAEDFYGEIPTKYNTNGYSETVANNVIDTVSTRGIDVDFQDGLATHNTTITGNTVRINTSLTDYILKVNTAGGTIITNNRFQGSLSTIGCYFQRATGDSTQTNIFSNNIFRDFAGQGVHFQGLKRSIVSGNNFDSISAAALVFENSTSNRISDNTYKAGAVLNITSANGNSDNFISGNIGASITADNLTSILSFNYPNNQQNITGTPRIPGQTAVSGTDIYISNGTTSSANWIRLTPASRTISTTAPLSGGGDLTANRTFSMTQANTSTNGWLSSTDWNTFNNKLSKTLGDTLYLRKLPSQIFPYDSSYIAPPSDLFSNNSNGLEMLNMGNTIRSNVAFERTPMGIVRNNWSLLLTNNMIYDSTYQGWNLWNTTYPASCMEAGWEGITLHYTPHGYSSLTLYPHEGLQVRGGIDGITAYDADSQYVQLKTTMVGRYDTAFDAGNTAYGWGYSRKPFNWYFSEYPTKQLTGNIYSSFDQYYTGATSGPISAFMRSRGTYLSKTAVQSGDTLGNIGMYSYDGGKFLNTGRIYAYATSNAASNNAPTNVIIQASNGNATTGLATISNTGRLGVNTTSPLGIIHTVNEGFNGAWYSVRYAAGQTNVPPSFYGVAARGTAASPAAVQKGDILVTMDAAPHDGTSFDFVSRAAMRLVADTTFTTGVKSTRFDLILTNVLNDGRRVFSVDHNGHGAFADTTAAERLFVDGSFRAAGTSVLAGNVTMSANGTPGTGKFPKGTDAAGNFTWQTLAASDLPAGSGNYVQVQTASPQSGGFSMSASSYVIGTATTALNVGQTGGTSTNTAGINLDGVNGDFVGLDYLELRQSQDGNARLRNNNSGGSLVLGSGGSSSANLTLSPTGNVGVAESSPQSKLSISGNTSSYLSIATPYASTSVSSNVVTAPTITVSNTSSTSGAGGFYQFQATNGNGLPQIAYLGAVSNAGAGQYTPEIVMGRSTGASAYAEVMRITSGGNMGIGRIDPFSRIHAEAATATVGTFVNTSALGAASGAGVNLLAAGTPSATGQQLGQLAYGSNTSGSTVWTGARIAAFSSGAWTAGSSQPTYLAFYTTQTGASTPTEKVRIDTAGRVGVGVVPTSTLQSSGSFSAAITAINTSTTLNETHHTVRVTASGITITFPAASSCPGRIYCLINYNTGGSFNTSSILTPAGAAGTTVSNQTIVWVQSDGSNWYQIR